MRRKILVALLGQTVLLIAGGIYIAWKIDAASRDVLEVLSLHQVGRLRQQFLAELEALQSGAALHGSDAPQGGRSSPPTVSRCFGCHHAEDATRRLRAIEARQARYEQALTEASSARGPAAERAKAEAFRLGQELVAEVQGTVDRSDELLQRHTRDALRSIARTHRLVFGLLVLGPLLSALLGFVWTSSFTRPLEALIRATRRLAAGDLGHRVEPAPDELGALGTAFNDMASALQENVRHLQRTEQLAVAGEMAAGLVHEIKNPLAGIKAAAQVLISEGRLTSQDELVLRRVEREVVGLEGLLRSFLEFARPPRPQLADVDLNAVVEAATSLHLRAEGARPGRAEVTKVLGALPPVHADASLLQHVVVNVLLNALEVSPDGAAVEIRTSFDAGACAVAIEVADRGPGIAPEQARRVFEPFYSTKPHGTGLGLAVSKRLVEQHDGTLTFAPRPGGGTVFRIQLPAATRRLARIA